MNIVLGAWVFLGMQTYLKYDFDIKNICSPHSSVGKESAYNAGDPDQIPGSGRSMGEGVPTPVLLGFKAGEESSHNVGDLGLIPGLGRSPGEGKGYPLQYSGLENSMDSRVARVGHD